MRSLIPSILWLTFIYVLTALSQGLPPPEGFWARLFDEARHIAAHAGVYGIQALLIAHALGITEDGWQSWRPLIALILVLGIGQEALQALMRHRIQVIGTPFDLLVDVGGAALALWLYPKIRPLLSRRFPLTKLAVSSKLKTHDS